MGEHHKGQPDDGVSGPTREGVSPSDKISVKAAIRMEKRKSPSRRKRTAPKMAQQEDRDTDVGPVLGDVCLVGTGGRREVDERGPGLGETEGEVLVDRRDDEARPDRSTSPASAVTECTGPEMCSGPVRLTRANQRPERSQHHDPEAIALAA